MTINANLPGTKYSLEMNLKGDTWHLSLTIGGTVEETVEVKNLSLREVTNSVEEVLKGSQANANPFQIELICKNLYKKASGDDDMSLHNQSMDEIETKKQMAASGDYQADIANEFKSQFQVKQDAPKKKQKEIKKPAPRETQQIEANKERPEMKSMVSEINKNLEKRETSNPQASTGQTRSQPKSATSNLQSPDTQIDTRVSSVDIEDLINELLETKQLLQSDIVKVNKRMEKIDNIIRKISSISSKL